MRKLVLLFVMVFVVTGLVLAATTKTEPAGKTTEKGLAAGDKRFVDEAANGGMMEVELGQLAATKAQSADVKDFANRMVTDHGKANDELKALAAQKNIKLPAAADHKTKSTKAKLEKATAADFDKIYMKDMVTDHEADVAKFEKASKDVKDADIKAWVDKTLPTLQEHLKLAKDVAQKVGAMTEPKGTTKKKM